MAAFDYLCLGGVELTNSARTTAYMANGVKPHTMSVREGCGCADLGAMLGHETYRRPDLDVADPPDWVDPNVPESYEFAGLLVTNIEGLDAAPRSRVITDRIGDGAVIGRARLGPRVITVTGLLIGSSCCGIDYGMRWLSAALNGPPTCGGTSCGGTDLTYLTCCPEICEDAPDFVSAEDCAADYWRTLRDVALTDGPTATGFVGGACHCCAQCPAREVQFTLIAGRPHALRDAVMVADGETWQPGDTESACVTWSNDPDCVDDDAGCAADAASCLDLALAELGCATTMPPELPVPDNPCACDPLTRRRHCIVIPSSVLTPIWSDVVTDVEIYAGSLALKAVRIRFYPNPLGRPIDQLDACAFCAEANLSVVPAFSTVRVDGTRRRVTVTCPGTDEVPAGGAVTGTNGGPFTWPTLECGTPYLMCVEADTATIAPDSEITVRVHSREA